MYAPIIIFAIKKIYSIIHKGRHFVSLDSSMKYFQNKRSIEFLTICQRIYWLFAF